MMPFENCVLGKKLPEKYSEQYIVLMKSLTPLSLLTALLALPATAKNLEMASESEWESTEIEAVQTEGVQTRNNQTETDSNGIKREQTQSLDDEKELPLKYPVAIHVADASIKAMIEEYLPLITYQKKEELDEEQLSFLLEDAYADIQTMLRTRGYFNSKIEIEEAGNGFSIQITLGRPMRIDNVSLAIVGDVLQDESLADYYKNSMRDWQLPVGGVFNQDAWAESKTSVLSALTRKKYPLASFMTTEAQIDPTTQKAQLNVLVDSREPVYFGAVEITGVQRYPEGVARGLAKFKTGDAYDLDKLLDYQQALESNSHYAAASVSADFSQMEEGQVPVKVELTEVKRQKFDAGVLFDSEYGFGGKIGYDHYNVFGRGYIGSFSMEMDKYQTQTALGISQPRRSNGHYATAQISYGRSTTHRLERRTLGTGLWYVFDKEKLESRYGIEFTGEDASIPADKTLLDRSFATMLTAAWRYQTLQTRLRPENGYYIEGKLGSTLGKALSSTLVSRAYASGGYFFTPENKKIGTLVLRGSGGYVYTKQQYQAPSVLMFRTGGATSVRGYELDSIGRHLDVSNTVLPERALLTGSVEYQYPVGNNFSVALFHDVGGTGKRMNDIEMKHGSGLGLRWFSPIAPFSFDLAYGHQDQKMRWHISLGTRF